MGTFDGTKWNFDFPFNSPDSAETALFFALNFAHDFFYDLGFDEASGNFQVDNFNRGGSGGDPVKGNARAAGRNNANYMHAADGTSPKINMFLWDSNELLRRGRGLRRHSRTSTATTTSTSSSTSTITASASG